MTGSPTGRRAAALVFSGALAALALTGCTSPPTGAESPSPEVTSAPASPSATVSASPSAAESPSPTPSETSAADSVTIDITIADGQVRPNGSKVNVRVGQQVVLNVTSDEHDAVHAHTEGEGYELQVPAGKKVSGKFTLNSPGSYEVESHHLEKVIVILNAR